MKTSKMPRIAILLVFAALLSGCAQTVTPVFAPGKSITMDIYYRGDIDTASNKYYLIFNKNAAPQIPFEYVGVQFVEPGVKPDQPEVDYYGKYYPTWMAFIVLDGPTYYFVHGPFTSEAVPTREAIAERSGLEKNRILLTFDLDKIGSFTQNDRLHFDIVSVDKASKMVKDNLSLDNRSPSSKYVYTIQDTVAFASDEAIAGTWESLDISNWRILIQ